VKQIFLYVPLFLFLATLAHAGYFSDRPDFSLLFHGGAEQPNGFIQGSSPLPELGGWMGIGIDDHLDGFFGLDYYGMPNQPVTLTHPLATTPGVLTPTDDISLTLNTRWYFLNSKWDYARHYYNISPYLFAGLGMDLVVDNPPSGGTTGPGPALVSSGYDILFSTTFGAGIDFPIGDGRRWSIYTEALDHLIFWQNLTQVYDGRVGVRFMLDTAHADPFH
jgi:hypothetical protein